MLPLRLPDAALTRIVVLLLVANLTLTRQAVPNRSAFPSPDDFAAWLEHRQSPQRQLGCSVGIFLHIPKTGGTTIADEVFNHWSQTLGFQVFEYRLSTNYSLVKKAPGGPQLQPQSSGPALIENGISWPMLVERLVSMGSTSSSRNISNLRVAVELHFCEGLRAASAQILRIRRSLEPIGCSVAVATLLREPFDQQLSWLGMRGWLPTGKIEPKLLQELNSSIIPNMQSRWLWFEGLAMDRAKMTQNQSSSHGNRANKLRCGPIRLDQNHPQMSLAERRALLLMLDHEVDVVGTTHFFNDSVLLFAYKLGIPASEGLQYFLQHNRNKARNGHRVSRLDIDEMMQMEKKQPGYAEIERLCLDDIFLWTRYTRRLQSFVKAVETEIQSKITA